jgi:hypothetical protein
MKKILTLISLGFICVIIFVLLWTNRIWPFSTGSNTPAFLGTTFEMSLPEVQRALKKIGIQLVDIDTFKKLDPELSKKEFFLSYDFELALGEDKLTENKVESWYMPSIKMFNSRVVADFSFNERKLEYITVSIYPFTKNSLQVVEEINSELKKKYRFIEKQLSKEVPGAYSLVFKGTSSSVNFWVNLTDQANPIIKLFMSYKINAATKREAAIQKRQMNAF